MARFLPAHLWAMHPLYLADALLLCAHVSSALHSDPQLARDSHFLHGAHPLRSVEVAGTVTYAALGQASLKLALDDGSGPAVQVVVYANSAAAAGLPGGAAGLARALRVGDALVATGALGWGYPSGSAAGGVVREVRVQRLRVLRGAGGGLNELCRWWARAQRLHAELYCRPLAALLPSCTPFALAPVAPPAAGAGSGSSSSEAAAGTASRAAAAAALPPAALPAPQPALVRLPLPLAAAARGGGGVGSGRGALAGLPTPAPYAAAAAAAAAPLPSSLFSRLVMLLQNALDLHHPRTTGSALAVSQAQAESRRRARGLAAVRGAGGGGGGGAPPPAQGGEAGEGGEGEEGSAREGGDSGEDSGDGEEGEGGGLGQREARTREAEGRLDASMREEQEWQAQGAAAAPGATAASAPEGALAAPAAAQGGMDSDAETVLDEEDAMLASAPAAAAAAARTASSADIAAAFAAGRWVFSVGVSASDFGAAQAHGAAAEEDGSTAIVSTIAASPSVLTVGRRASRGGAGAGAGSSSSSAASAAPPAAAAIAEVFTVADAVALLGATEPGILREVCAHLRLPPLHAAAAAAAAVAPSVAQALHCLVDEGVVCAMPSAGRGAPLLFSMVTPRHVIAPATVEVLLGRGAVWDGMAVEEEAGEAAGGGGGGGGGAASPLPVLTEVELVKELRQRLPLRSVPIAVLRAAWRGMEEDAVLVRPSLHTFALPKP